MRIPFGGLDPAARLRALLVLLLAAAAVAGAVLLLTSLTDEDLASFNPPFVADVEETPAVLWAVGDGDASPDGRRVVELMEQEDFDRLLYLGDVYEEGTAREFEINYEPSYGRIADRIAPTLGDHESGNAKTGYEPYWEEKKGVEPPTFYGFEAGGWDILALNSEANHEEDSPQLRWLRDRVEAPGTCRLAFWHRPYYNAGTIHHGDRDVGVFWDALRERASIVANANEHNMQRFEPARGITQFIAGTGGHALYELERDPPERLAFADASSYGAVRFELQPGSATWEFVTVDGEVLDSGEIECVPLAGGASS